MSTTAAQEAVSVLIKVMDGNGNTVKTHYDNFTAYRFGSQPRVWNFYAYYTGYYQLNLVLYDSQSRQEDTDNSGMYYLDTGTVKRWITASTTLLDLDKDSFKDDVEVHVTNWTDKDVSGARVWINGSYIGNTNSTGEVIGRNYPKGWINVDVFWKDLHNSTSFKSEGDGTVAGGFTVRAEVYDDDDDDLEDDVLITVTNQLGLPVRNAQITFNGTNQGTTSIAGELDVLNVRRGFWIVNATKLNNYGSTTFFSEGQGAGTETDEYFFDIEEEVVDLDKDDRMNDLKMRFDVDVDPAVKSTVTVWANLSWWGNGTSAHNVSTTFTTNGTETDWHDLYVRNITYGRYWISYELLDSNNNSEDFAFAIIEAVRPSNHVNIETGVFYEDDDNEMDDALFRAVRVDQVEPNITVKMYNETGALKRTGKTNANGRIWFHDLADGVFNWTAKDEAGRLIEKGRIVIGARVQVDTDLTDLDSDGFYDDFAVRAYNNVDRAVHTVSVTVWAPNGTEVTSNLTLGGQLTTINLTKGTYEFNATYQGEELVNGTFYSYGNVDEPFTIYVLPEARDLDGDGRYDDVNVSVVDTDDSPMEFASVYVDGVYRTKTDLNGYAEVKDLTWGIHTIEAHYSGEVAKAQFFSEGKTTDKPSWVVLVVSWKESQLQQLEDVGSTNDTLLLYYAETTDARPKASHLWIALKGRSQEIDLGRLGLTAGKELGLEDAGVMEALVKKALGAYSAQRTALLTLTRSPYDFSDRYGFERTLTNITTDMGSTIDLVLYDTLPFFSIRSYEIRTAADYVVAIDLFTKFPLKESIVKVTTTPGTSSLLFGEHIIDEAKRLGDRVYLLLDMSKMGAYAQALDTLSSRMVSAYPTEGWNIQDARNVSGISETSEQFALAAKLGDELATRVGSSSIATAATAFSQAASQLEVKVSDNRFGIELIFPNQTDLWDESTIGFIKAGKLAEDTHWDEFLVEFWRFRNYTIEVHATVYDEESSGRDNDVLIYVNDTYGQALSGARVHIDLQFEGTTDAAGELEAYNYTRGIHLVNVTWHGYEAETIFTSEGTVIPNQAPSVAITDPEEDDEVSGIHDIEGTSSDPDGIVSYVEVRFNGSAWQRAIGRASWRFEWDTRDLADGDWLIEARAHDGDLYSTIAKVNVTVYNPVVYEDILLVDDDGGDTYETWYTAALVAAGESFDTITVPRGDNGPDAERLGHAKIVIWFTGEEDENTLTAADVQALTAFLNGGGALFLTGQDVGRDLTSVGTVTSAFMRDYLRADFVSDNANDYSLIAVPDEDISEGVNISIEGGTGAPNQNYPSEIQPRNGASVVYLYNGTAEAAVKYGSTTFRTVYFAFGFEGISVRQDRNRIMENILAWLASNQTTSDNLPPEVNAGSDVVTTVDEVAIFRGIATDPDGLVALFEWDFDGDGTYDWSNDTTGRAQWTFDTAGNHTAGFRATDNMGDFATDSVSVEVRPKPPNQPPTADAGADIEVDQGDPVEFLMAGFDPDGSIVLYEWDYDGDGTYDEASPVPVATTHIYYDPGEYTATLRVTDDRDATGTDSRVVTVNEKVQNQLPTADAGPDLEAQVGSEVTLVGTGEDPDGSIVSYKWDFDGDGEYDPPFSTTTGTAVHTYDDIGDYVARLLVIDDMGGAATDTCNVTITPVHVNQPPTADSGSDDIVEVVQGEEVEFQGTGTDPDGYIALYEWDFDGDETYDWNDTQARVAVWTYEETGLVVARFRVTDNDGATDVDVYRVQVISAGTANKPPTADAGGPYDGVSGQTITLRGTGSDPDGLVVSYEWDFEGDGTVDHHSPVSGTTTVTYERSGTFSAVLYVTDDQGAVTSSVAEVRIAKANAPPTAMITDPVQGQVLKGYYVVRGTANDDIGLSRVEIRIDDGSWERVNGLLAWTFDLDTSGLVAGTHTLQVRAVDSDGLVSGVASVSFTIDEPEVQEEEPSIFSGFMLWVIILLVVIPLGVSIVYVVKFKTGR